MKEATFILLHDLSVKGGSLECERWINPFHIVFFVPYKEGTYIKFINDSSFYSVESYFYVVEKLTGKNPFEATETN